MFLKPLKLTLLRRGRLKPRKKPWSIFHLYLCVYLQLLPLAVSAADCRLGSADYSSPDAIPALLQREAACADDPDFLYHLGRLLNLAGQYAEADERLEAALLRAPDDARVQIEYALALAGSGDAVAAQHLLDQARRHAKLDTATRSEIDDLLTVGRWRALLPQGSLALSFGYDDNLLGAAKQGPFEITLPYTNLVVIPAGSQQPRGGSFIRADLRLDGQLRTDPERPLRYSLFGSLRHTPSEPADRLQWGGVLENNNTFWPDDYGQAAWQQIAIEGKTIYRQLHLAAGRSGGFETAGWICQQRLGLELQNRDYPQTDVLDGYYTGLHAQFACPAPALLLDLRLGQDHARHAERPGGDQRLLYLRVAHQRILGDGILQLEAEWSWLRDADGYSPLLENNRTREMRRDIYRLEYRWADLPDLPGWQPFASFEWLEQDANLPLFSVRNRVFGFGLVHTW